MLVEICMMPYDYSIILDEFASLMMHYLVEIIMIYMYSRLDLCASRNNLD